MHLHFWFSFRIRKAIFGANQILAELPGKRDVGCELLRHCYFSYDTLFNPRASASKENNS